MPVFCGDLNIKYKNIAFLKFHVMGLLLNFDIKNIRILERAFLKAQVIFPGSIMN